MTAYLSTPKAEAPRPTPAQPSAARVGPEPSQAPTDLPNGTRAMRIRPNGTIRLKRIAYMIDSSRAGQEVLVIIDSDTILVSTLAGEILIEHTRPAHGVNYVGNGRPRGPRPRTTQTSPKS